MNRCLWRPISIFMAWSLMLCNGNRTQNALPPTFFYFFGQSLGWRFVTKCFSQTENTCYFDGLLSSPFLPPFLPLWVKHITPNLNPKPKPKPKPTLDPNPKLNLNPDIDCV